MKNPLSMYLSLLLLCAFVAAVPEAVADDDFAEAIVDEPTIRLEVTSPAPPAHA